MQLILDIKRDNDLVEKLSRCNDDIVKVISAYRIPLRCLDDLSIGVRATISESLVISDDSMEHTTNQRV